MLDCQSGKMGVRYQIAVNAGLGEQGRKHAGVTFRRRWHPYGFA